MLLDLLAFSDTHKSCVLEVIPRNCTIYENTYTNFDPNSNIKYISHRVTPKFQNNPNVFYLTCLSPKNVFTADILPYTTIRSTKPVYIIQGNLQTSRRNYHLLTKILDGKYKYDFEIRMVGRGTLPQILDKYKSRINLQNNLNFVDYHKQFLDGYCILPLITKKTHPQYYSTTLTSSINYIKGYNLKSIIDKDLQNIYQLKNTYIFDNIEDVQSIFAKSLEDFYNKSNNYLHNH